MPNTSNSTIQAPLPDEEVDRILREVLPEELKIEQPKPPEPIFTYSDAERAEIEAATGGPLSEDIWRELRAAADRYHIYLAERRRGYLKPSERAATYARAARTCGKLRVELEAAAKTRMEPGADWRPLPFVILSKELTQTLRRALDSYGSYGLDAIGTDVPKESGPLSREILSAGDVADFLTEVERELANLSNPFYWGTSRMVSVTGRTDPSVIYSQRVLWIWTNELGRDLKRSWNSVENKDSGPLARYFFAVARPVMGRRTPSSKSLKNIVKRQKQFLKWHKDYEKQWAEIRQDQERAS
jgi:hypothetical protein